MEINKEKIMSSNIHEHNIFQPERGDRGYCTSCKKKCKEVKEIGTFDLGNDVDYSYTSGCCNSEALDLDCEEDLMRWKRKDFG